jgi:hypothetical protein
MGGEQLPVGRGPRPWREPRSRDQWLATIAWLELSALVAWAALLAYLNWTFADLDSIACFDGSEPACTTPETGFWFGQTEAAASALVLVAGVVAAVVTRRHLRGDGSRLTALTALAAPALCASVAAVFTEVPV